MEFQLKQIHFGAPAYGGNGCPTGSLSGIETLRTGEIKVLLDMNLETRGQQSPFSRVSCNIRIPVRIEPGYQIGIQVGKATGFLAQEPKSKTTAKVDAGLSGSLKSSTVTRTWNGATHSDFVLFPMLAESLWTACGANETMIRLDTVVSANRSDTSKDVLAVMNELSLSYSIYTVFIIDCFYCFIFYVYVRR